MITNQKSVAEDKIVIDPALETMDLPIQTKIDRPLADPRSLLQLPSDFLKTPVTTYEPAYNTFDFSHCLADLEGQARQDDISEEYCSAKMSRSLLVAAFNALLYRYTQQEDLNLALTFLQNQTKKYTAEINTQIFSKLTVRELVRQTTITLNGIGNQPATLQHQRWIENQPHSQTNHPMGKARSETIAITLIEQETTPEQIAKLVDGRDLQLVILRPFSGILIYNANLFKPDTIDRLLGHLQVLVEGMIRLDCSIAQLPLLTQPEQQLLLKNFTLNDSHSLVHQQIEAHALRQPQSIAVQMAASTEQLTYAELNQRANQLAHYLINVGVGISDRIAVCVEPTLEIAAIVLGIFKAGGVYVPLDPTHPIDRLTTILEDIQPKVLITQSHLSPSLPQTTAQIFCLDTDGETLPSATHNPEIEIHLNETAYIIYTSGTTGKPKGVMASYGNLAHYIGVAKDQFGFNDRDVMPTIARFTFSITMFELLSPLVAGGRLVILDRSHILDFKCLAQTLQQLTVLHTSPSLMQKLLAYIQDKNLDLKNFHNLRHVSCGGDLVSASLLETMKSVFQKAEVYVIYGCSEVSCMGCNYPVSRSQTVTRSFVGKPFRNVHVRLYDPHQNLVPIGIPGEIYISGAGITTGYLNQETLTQEKFVAIDGQRFYRTGDLGRFDADGNLEILGRADFQIKLRGIRIELGEIEAALRQSPGVREGVVVARDLGNYEKSLVAYVVLDPAKNSTMGEARSETIAPIRRFLQTKLPDYMVPAAFVVLEAMPVNHNQKLDRRALPDPNLVRSSATETVAPANEVEQQLMEIWQKTLNLQSISVKDNFFDLGGHSLLAIGIVAAIEEKFGKSLSVTALYQAPTVETLAIALQTKESPTLCRSLMVIQPGQTKPPLFCIHVLGRGLKFYRPLARYLSPDQPLYGLSVQIVDRDETPRNRVEDLATYYIKEMQILQPAGPYLLAGISFGGVVAFEMARQLEAQGQTVGLLAMMDTDGPDAVKPALVREKLSAHRSQLLQFGLSYAFRKANDKIQGTAANWRAKLYDGFRHLSCNYYLSRGLSLPDRLHDFAFLNEHRQASKLYTPQRYSGNLILFRAIDRSIGTGDVLDPKMGWGNLAGGVEVLDVPGNHLSMLQEPNIRVLAERLKLYL